MNPRSLKPALLALVASACLVACGGGNPERHLAAAKEALDKHEPKVAVIELKNALQKNPESADIRFLLGRALLEDGDAVLAAVELRKAIDLKHPPAQAVPVLARALNASGQYDRLTEQYASTTLDDANATAELKSALAFAFQARGNAQQARQQVDAALLGAPGNATARVMDARLKIAAGDREGALTAVEAVLAKAPNDEDALMLRGDLLGQHKNDAAGAQQAYRKVIGLNKNSLVARVALLNLMLEKPQLPPAEIEAAQAELALLKKAWPGSLHVTWFEARIALARGDFKDALKISERLLAKAPNEARFIYLGGLANYMAGSSLQAESQFGKLLQLAPDNHRARLMLARTQLRLSQPAKAFATIQPLLDDKLKPSSEVLGIAGQASVMRGDTAKAREYFTRALAADPNDTNSRTALALMKLSTDQPGGGVEELRGIAAADKGTAVDMRLVNALLGRRDFDGALRAVDQLEKKQPAGAMANYLRGTILLAKQDPAGARAALEKSAAADAKFYPAAARLAVLDVADKKPEQAKQRFERVLAADPKNTQAALALIDVRAVNGASKEEIAEQLGALIKSAPTDVGARVRLVEHYIRFNDGKAALAAARDANAALPDNPTVLTALGTAQHAAGELNQAASTFSKLVALQPNSPMALMRLASVQAAAKDPAGAIQTLNRAWVIAPTAPQVQRALIGLLVAANRQGEAVEIAKAVQKQGAKAAIGEFLEGDIEASRKNWTAAVNAYRTAHAKSKSPFSAVTLHAALLNAKRDDEAAKFATEWQAQSPKDGVFISHLGDAAIGRKDYAAAEARFLDVLRLDANQAVAMNNVAWLRMELKKPGALEYAEKATRLKPDEPAFLDTLASVLAADKQIDKAVEAQKKAVALTPDNPALRMRLAQLFIAHGDKASAKAELERLAKLGDGFARQGEVGQLLKTL